MNGNSTAIQMNESINKANCDDVEALSVENRKLRTSDILLIDKRGTFFEP